MLAQARMPFRLMKKTYQLEPAISVVPVSKFLNCFKVKTNECATFLWHVSW